MQMIKDFGEFKQIMRGRNPMQILNKLLESGEMSQGQFSELKEMAEGLLSILR